MGWRGGAALAAATLVLTSDVTAMSVALPVVESDLGTELTTVQWVINAYLLAFGVSIVTGGWLADRLGRRRILVFGLVAFSAAALLGGLAPSVQTLIAARALQGVGAGLIWPAVLGAAYAAAAPRRRIAVIGLALGAAGVGEALGPLVGGWLASDLSWRWILLAKPVLGAVAVAACLVGLGRDRPGSRHRVDFPGLLALSGAAVGLMVALDEAADSGWGSPLVLGWLTAAAALAAAFVAIERRVADPLLPPEALRTEGLLGALLLMLTTAPMFFVGLMYVPQILEKQLGFGSLETGVAMLPMQLVFAAVAPLTGLVAVRVGLKAPHVAGLVAMAASGLAFALFGPGDGYGELLGAMALYGVGVGLAYPAVTALAMTGLPAARASLSAGVLFMFELIAGALMTALATHLVASRSRSVLAELLPSSGLAATADQDRVLQGVLAGTDSAPQVLGAFGPAEAERAMALAERAFLAGTRTAFLAVAAVALAGAVLAAVLSRGRTETRAATGPTSDLSPRAGAGAGGAEARHRRQRWR